MSWNRSMRSLVAVVLVCAAAACTPDGPGESVLGPDIVLPQNPPTAEDARLSPSDSALLANQGFYWINAPVTHPRTLLGWLVQTVRTTLSLDLGVLGGVLELLGHTLSVPEGAVTRTTTFTMALLPTGRIEVELTAVPKSLLARLLFLRDNEPIQFNVPVTLSLSYENATNVVDPSRLRIARVLEDGTYEFLPSRVDTQAQTVSADLDHFSRYCMIAD